MPTTNSQWSVFVQRLVDYLNLTRDAANRTGVNVVPAAYAVYDAPALPALTIVGATGALDATKTLFGNASLKLTATATTVTVQFTGNPITLAPFMRWIESVYIQSSRTSITGTMAVVTANGSYPVDISGALVPAQWGRLYGDCDLTADDSTSATILLTLTGCSAGDTFNLEGWQLEAAAGNTNLPSAFVNSAAAGSLDSVPDGSDYSRIDASHVASGVAYNYRGVWSSATAYVTGDEIVYAGSYWLCKSPNTNSTPTQASSVWQAVGAYNDFQGAWSSSTAYQPGMEVTSGGNFWVCVVANTNSTPAVGNSNWAMAGPQSLDNITDGTNRFAASGPGTAPLVNNPYFSTGDLSGWTSDHGTVTFQSGTNGPAAGSSAYAIRTGSSGTPAEALRNTAKIPVYPGAQIKAQCAIRGIGTPNGAAGVRISWRNSSDTEIATTQGTTTTGNATNGTYVTGTAPSGAMFAHVECSFTSHTVGQYTVDNFWAAMLPDTMDQVPDGITRFGAIEAGADKTSGKPLSSLSGRTLDYIGDSAAYARTKASALQNGIPLQASTGRNLVVNGSFEANASGAQFGDGWIPNGVAILGRNTAVSGGPSPVALQYNQSPGTVIPTGYAYYVVDSAVNLTGLRIGDTVYISAQFNNAGGSLPAGITGTVQVELDFLNSGGTTISSVVATSPQTAGWPTATGNGVVPTGTVATRARVLIYTNNTTGSAYTVPAGQYPFFGYVDNITAYAVANADTDVMDGATNGRIAMADVYGVGGANRVGLRVAGSGQTLGDQRNLQPITWASQRSVLSNSPISFSISGTTVTFSVAAVSLQGGGITLNYGASSGSVTQTAGTTTTYFLYYRDSAQAGGSLPLAITTNPGGAASFPDSIFLGTANVTVNSGGGGSSGTGGGGGGYCVADDMYIGEGRLAGNAEIGDPFDCIDLPTSAGKHVRALQGVSRGMEECVRMITSDGCALVCSVSTPFDLPDGRQTTAPRMLGEQVITDLGTATVISLALVGPHPVTRAHLGGVSYAAGADPHRRIYSHNIGGTSKP